MRFPHAVTIDDLVANYEERVKVLYHTVMLCKGGENDAAMSAAMETDQAVLAALKFARDHGFKI